MPKPASAKHTGPWSQPLQTAAAQNLYPGPALLPTLLRHCFHHALQHSEAKVLANGTDPLLQDRGSGFYRQGVELILEEPHIHNGDALVVRIG